MRISTPLMTSNALLRLQDNAQRLFEVQDQLSSGKRFLHAADDPPAANRAAALRSGLAAVDRYARAADYAQGTLSQLDSTLAQIVDTVRSVRDVALQAANTSPSPGTLDALAAQVADAMEALVNAGNTQRIAGIYMFAGYRSTTAPFVNTGAAPPVDYVGDSGQARVELGAGIQVAVNITGDELYNMSGAADPALDDMFTTLASLRDEILAGDANAVSARVSDLDAHLNRILGLRGEVGARLRQVQFMADRAADSKETLTTLLSATEDVDMAKAIVDLQAAQNRYQATAAVVASVQGLRLLDYLP
jgi:flagellar hook-associated protein 3 FlgL